jgi:outer membrane protein OmpA-like peptidoglycan-associated protein
MRPVRFILLLLLCGSLSLSISLAQEQGEQLPPGYYIVVAAYRKGQEDYAKRYISAINKDGRHSKYGYDAGRKYYYVYLDYYKDFNESIDEMLKTRKAGGFDLAWVRIMKDGLVEPVEGLQTPATVVGSVSESPKEVVAEMPVVEQKPVEVVEAIVEEVKEPVAIASTPKLDSIQGPKNLSKTPVFLKLYNSTNNKVIEGEIQIIDAERSRPIRKVKANDYLTLPDPGTKSGKLTLLCDVFGYRKVQHEIHYKDTEADTAQSSIDLMGNYYLVKFDMIRIHRGDISTLYNVYFYNDAAIMLPESKFELNSLLGMLNENPKYKIVLHGHTNGNAAGKLLTMGESKNFFEISQDVKKGVGSAKDLSRERAEVIREWLIAQGISGDRMEVKAWGGKRMVHDRNSEHARKNVRVEVEVVEE